MAGLTFGRFLPTKRIIRYPGFGPRKSVTSICWSTLGGFSGFENGARFRPVDFLTADPVV